MLVYKTEKIECWNASKVKLDCSLPVIKSIFYWDDAHRPHMCSMNSLLKSEKQTQKPTRSDAAEVSPTVIFRTEFGFDFVVSIR